MSSIPAKLDRGMPYPLGATWDGLGTNFAVFSAHAERIELCLFDPAGRREIARIDLPECTDEIWHGYLPNGRLGLIYGYRAMVPIVRRTGTASIRISFCSIPTRGALPEVCAGPTRYSDIVSIHRAPIFPTTGETVRLAHLKLSSVKTSSTGVTIVRPASHGRRRSFTRRMYAA